MKQMWMAGAAATLSLVVIVAAHTPTHAQGAVPSGESVLGTVTIPRAVTADGKPLGPGAYTLRLTAQSPEAAPGLNQSRERWVEFVRGGKVVAREIASIVPAAEVKETMPGPDMPGKGGASGARVEMLKGGEFLRIWITRGGNNYLLHLPPQGAAAK
jgi:hypothetical protein